MTMESKRKNSDKELKLAEARRNKRSSYWEHLLSQYEKRNATLEKQQAALAERVKFMECALPSLLMGAVINSSQKPSNSRSASQEGDV